MISEETPIFVRGMSRSGGTLLVTLLDAHPQIAMSYELYPNLLDDKTEKGVNISPEMFIEDLVTEVEKVSILSLRLAIKRAVRVFAGKRLLQNQVNNWHSSVIRGAGPKTFYLRCDRGGLNRKDLVRLLEAHISENMNFESVPERLRFIERCCLTKMQRENKRCWGLKCSNDFEAYHAVWPQSYFINVIRDGRDVLASQLNTGSFKNTPGQVGEAWSRLHHKFREFARERNTNTYEIYYEQLVENPEEEVSKLCGFLGIDFFPEMLAYYEKDLTIYDASHLSMGRITKPIDSKQVNRWKTDLNTKQLAEFMETAVDMMIELGYVS